MIDKVKRNTLKRMGIGAATVASVSISAGALANLPLVDPGSSVLSESLSLADIQVQTRVSSLTNDIEVLISNVGATPTTITQMTPALTVTKRGQFDFAQLLTEGDITLAPGQYVTVPMTRHGSQISAADTSNNQAGSLTGALRRSFSVITENDSFAKVSVVDGMRFV